ncbi:MAG: DUF2309 domain-containing protein [Alphaproteobacteria bacterium]
MNKNSAMKMEMFDQITPRKMMNTQDLIKEAWSRIAPCWPLRSLIAVNPLSGFEHMAFEDALHQGSVFFQQTDIAPQMEVINRHSIKWLKAFFDQGQSTIKMPLRNKGLFECVFSLMAFDRSLQKQSPKTWLWIVGLSRDPQKIILACLDFLGIKQDDRVLFLTLVLTALPGWASYIKYRAEWADLKDQENPYPFLTSDYLALRLILTCLFWPTARDLLIRHKSALENENSSQTVASICIDEKTYRSKVIGSLQKTVPQKETRYDAQVVFCIDVRSEPFRRALESQGHYETFGFAGFFGIPMSVKNDIKGEPYASCPVLLKPSYIVCETSGIDHAKNMARVKRSTLIKKLYQSLKYTFTTPFTLAEMLGVLSGVCMAWKSVSPLSYTRLTKKRHQKIQFSPDAESIPFEDQVSLAAGALRAMGLTENFSPVVIFCGHGSETHNNPYATALDCGACGGHHGAPNARVLAAILNKRDVSQALQKKGIIIPEDTYFVAACHNTTTDEVAFFETHAPKHVADLMKKIRHDFEKTRSQNCLWRSSRLGDTSSSTSSDIHVQKRAADWAQVRPEWGLAGNACFIVGPRSLTQGVDLEGRAFLHSYDCTKDHDNASLTLILTAPMVVAQWINAQYLFSTIDNVAFGSGSKVSANIVGKIGMMQGNASDLMNGLPLQSVYKSDLEPFHKPLRLMTVVFAPRKKIEAVINQQEILKKLFGNGWVLMVSIDPETQERFELQRDFTWQKLTH